MSKGDSLQRVYQTPLPAGRELPLQHRVRESQKAPWDIGPRVDPPPPSYSRTFRCHESAHLGGRKHLLCKRSDLLKSREDHSVEVIQGGLTLRQLDSGMVFLSPKGESKVHTKSTFSKAGPFCVLAWSEYYNTYSVILLTPQLYVLCYSFLGFFCKLSKMCIWIHSSPHSWIDQIAICLDVCTPGFLCGLIITWSTKMQVDAGDRKPSCSHAPAVRF